MCSYIITIITIANGKGKKKDKSLNQLDNLTAICKAL